MAADYFLIFGVLFTGYCLFRFFLWPQYHMDFRSLPPEKVDNSPGKPIDATALSNRVRDMREHRMGRQQSQSVSFKQSLLVESCREKVAQSDYFRRPPPPDQPEEEHSGLTAILV